MKRTIKILAGIAAVIAIGLGVVFWMTSGMTDSANALFASIKAKEFEKAHQYLAQEFRAATSREEFEQFLSRSTLDTVKQTSWSGRSISGDRGELDGSVETATGATIPLKLKFVRENDQWKVFSIHKPRAGIAEYDENLPAESELVALTNESMLKFAQAVQAGDFSAFHAYVSRLWQREYTVQKFEEVFKVFLDAGVNMVPAVRKNAPAFDQVPEIKDNILIMKGHYPTRPSRIQFQLKYIYEGLGWKLVGTQVNIVHAPE